MLDRSPSPDLENGRKCKYRCRHKLLVILGKVSFLIHWSYNSVQMHYDNIDIILWRDGDVESLSPEYMR